MVCTVVLYLPQRNLKFEILSAIFRSLTALKRTKRRLNLGLIDEASILHEIYQIALTAGTNMFNTKFRTNVSLKRLCQLEDTFVLMIKESRKIYTPEEGRKLPAWTTLECGKDKIVRAGWVSLTIIRELNF